MGNEEYFQGGEDVAIVEAKDKTVAVSKDGAYVVIAATDQEGTCIIDLTPHKAIMLAGVLYKMAHDLIRESNET